MNKFPQFSGALPIDDKSILDALRGSPMIAKAASDRNAHVMAFRKTLVEKLAKLEADAEIKFPAMRVKFEAARSEALEAEIAWRQKADRAYTLQAGLSADSSLHQQALAQIEGQLAETASPEISMFISDMRTLWEDCFAKYDVRHETETVNQITRRRERRTMTNQESVQARQTAIREAIAAAEAMRLDPDQTHVAVRLQEIRNNLPAIASV
jgi:hypothetical protein